MTSLSSRKSDEDRAISPASDDKVSFSSNSGDQLLGQVRPEPDSRWLTSKDQNHLVLLGSKLSLDFTHDFCSFGQSSVLTNLTLLLND